MVDSTSADEGVAVVAGVIVVDDVSAVAVVFVYNVPPVAVVLNY